MGNYSLTRVEELYAQVQAAYGTIPNTAGAATLGNSNAMRFIKAAMDMDIATIKRMDKTGSRSRTAGVQGRMFGKWSLEASLSPNGVAGQKPDADPIFQGTFGQAGAATTATAANGFPAGTDVVDAANAYVYKFSDNIIPFLLASFRQPSTIEQRIAHSCVVNSLVLHLGQDGAATWNADGECADIVSSSLFTGLSTTRKAGLTAFPTKPVAPVTNGGIIAGFTGTALFGGTKLAGLRNGDVTITPGNVATKDTFGAFIPTGAEGDERNCNVKFSVYEDDTAGFTNLLDAAVSKTPIDVVFQIGTVPGSMVVVVCKGVQLNPPAREEQRRFIANFPDSPCNGSSLSAKDEVAIWFC